MLPIKKRTSLSEESRSSTDHLPPSKRTRTCSAVDGLLHLQREVALRSHLPTPASARTLAQDRARRLTTGSIGSTMTMPYAFGSHLISPESCLPHLNMLNSAAVPYPPFPSRNGMSNCVSRNLQDPNAKTSPLDLLSSVSSVMARSPSVSENSTAAPAAASATATSTAAPEKYLGERHPVTQLRHGKGIMKYSNGCRYVGFFVNDKREGFGKCWYSNGCVYTGQWKDGKRHGKGKITYINGDVYEGGWKEDQRHGAGVYHWKDGRADVCLFEEQKIVGEGCRWSPKRSNVWRLVDGEMIKAETVTLDYAEKLSKNYGVDFP